MKLWLCRKVIDAWAQGAQQWQVSASMHLCAPLPKPKPMPAPPLLSTPFLALSLSRGSQRVCVCVCVYVCVCVCVCVCARAMPIAGYRSARHLLTPAMAGVSFRYGKVYSTIGAGFSLLEVSRGECHAISLLLQTVHRVGPTHTAALVPAAESAGEREGQSACLFPQDCRCGGFWSSAILWYRRRRTS